MEYEYDYTAFPKDAARSRYPIVNFSAVSEKEVLHTLGDWWGENKTEGDYNPSVEFRLPSKEGSGGGGGTFLASLHFVDYSAGYVTARLHSGLNDDPVATPEGFLVMYAVVRHPRGTKVKSPTENTDKLITNEDAILQVIRNAESRFFDDLVKRADAEDRAYTRLQISMSDKMGNDMGYGNAARRLLRYVSILDRGAATVIKTAVLSENVYVRKNEVAELRVRMRKVVTERVAPFYDRLLAEGFRAGRLHNTVVEIKRAEKERRQPRTADADDTDFSPAAMADNRRRERPTGEGEDAYATPNNQPFRKTYRLTPEQEQELDAMIASALVASGIVADKVQQKVEVAVAASAIAAAAVSEDDAGATETEPEGDKIGLPVIPSLSTETMAATTIPDAMSIACASCGRDGAANRCKVCKKTHYCGRACQKKHWDAGHSILCAQMK